MLGRLFLSIPIVASRIVAAPGMSFVIPDEIVGDSNRAYMSLGEHSIMMVMARLYAISARGRIFFAARHQRAIPAGFFRG